MADGCDPKSREGSGGRDYGRRRDADGLWGEQDQVEIEIEPIGDAEFVDDVAREERERRAGDGGTEKAP